MPLTNLPPISAVDVQAAVITLVQHDPLLVALFPPPADGSAPDTVPAILADDPGGPDGVSAFSLALHILGEQDETGSLGGSGVGTRCVSFYLAAICYAAEPNRDPAQKRHLAQVTTALRAALMRYRSDPAPAPTQRWYQADFYRNPCTVYQTGGAFRRSITFVRYVSRFRTP